MADDLNLAMFRAYDIRTPAALLPPELATRLARAEAVYFRETLGVPAVLVAHDARSTGPQYLTLVADAFLDAGLDVWYLPGVCSTPHFYYAAICHPQAAAVLCGASHNPAGDTGQKILGPGVDPIAAGIGPAGGLDQVRQLYVAAAATTAPRRGRVRIVDCLDDYVRFSMELAGVAAGSLRGTRILMDFLHGAAGPEMCLAFARAGADLTPLHFVPDGRFPLGDPNPVKRAVIRSGLDTLAGGGFQCAMFFDGDGDRMDVYRGDGVYLTSGFVYAAVLAEICRQFPEDRRTAFADLKTNPLAVMEMARAGVAVDVIRNGHSQIKKSLIDDTSRMGAVEQSAHFYQAFAGPDGQRYCTENTLYMALLVARCWREAPGEFDRLIALQRRTALAREWGYKFPTDAARDQALAAVHDHFAGLGLQTMERMKNGMDLEAALMRRGLPFDIQRDARLEPDWLQVCQRISQSESGLARWEVVGDHESLVQSAKAEIAEIVRGFGASEEYQG